MSPKILIIDDDVNIRNLLNLFLLRKGFKTVLAEDGLEGIETAKRIHPDLIILDVLMPRMDGLKAARLIKSYKPLSRVPIIFLSAVCAENEMTLAREKQAEVYITKPFDVKCLGRAINDLLTLPANA